MRFATSAAWWVAQAPTLYGIGTRSTASSLSPGLTHRTMNERLATSLRSFSSGCVRTPRVGATLSFLPEGAEGVSQVARSFTPEQYARLRAVKTKYDFSNVFRLNYNIHRYEAASRQPAPQSLTEGQREMNQMQTSSSGLMDGEISARSEGNRIHRYGGPETLKLDEVPIPPYGEAQVLVHVMAAGVNGLDWKIRDGLLKEVRPLELPATLGFEIAGVVVAAGIQASKFALGERVVAPLGGMGAYADFVAIDEKELCAIPADLSYVDAAALPVAALTAWQALEVGGGPRAGQKILIHGAAGGVGGFAVQFAKAAGAMVIATASGADRNYVLGLGADQVIDYKAERLKTRLATLISSSILSVAKLSIALGRCSYRTVSSQVHRSRRFHRRGQAAVAVPEFKCIRIPSDLRKLLLPSPLER